MSQFVPDGFVPPTQLLAPRFRLEPLGPQHNDADLTRHAADFAARTGFTFTVLDPDDNDVIGCVYLYPTASPDYDVTVQSWVTAANADLDEPLADAVAQWLAADWPWDRVDRCGRGGPESRHRQA